MLCPWCGAQVPAAKYCANCGASLKGALDDDGDLGFGSFPVDAIPYEREDDPLAKNDDPSKAVLADVWPAADDAPAADAAGSPEREARAVAAATVARAAMAVSGASAGTPRTGARPSAGVSPTAATSRPASSARPSAESRAAVSQASPRNSSTASAGQQTRKPSSAASGQADAQGERVPRDKPSGQQPWYAQSLVVILLLLFFWPAGLACMWTRRCTWSKAVKLTVTAIIATFACINLMSSALIFYSPIYELLDGDSDSPISVLQDSGYEEDDEYGDVLYDIEEDLDDEELSEEDQDFDYDKTVAAFAGEWRLVGMVGYDDNNLNVRDNLELFTDGALKISLELESDGDAQFTMLGEDLSGSWEPTGPLQAVAFFDDDEMSMALAGKSLTLGEEGDDYILTFERA